jgi:hypothetical protein
MSTVSSSSKVAYMYDQASDTWYAVAGTANTNVAYTWNAAHTFGSIVTVNDVIRAKAGVNRFTNPTARNTVITSPVKGTVCFVEQTDGGTDINQLQIYNGTAWVGMLDTANLSPQITTNYNLGLADAGKTLLINSASDITVTVPINSAVPFATGQRLDVVRLGSGNVTFAGADVSININSKNSNKKIAARYSGATLIKYDTNTWVLIGDLTA